MLTANGQGSGVKTKHREWLHYAPKWQKVRHALAGELVSYLRNVGLNEPDKAYGEARQAEYEAGGIIYNFTRRTLSGMVGSVMRKEPEINIPKELEYLLKNADGSGVGLIQHAQDTLMEIDSVGRGGLLVDAPETGAATAAEQNAGLLNPTIAFYTTENIVNWRLTRVGSVNRVTMVVLRETWEYNEPGNEFETKYGEQYRVLDIDSDGNYRQRLFRFDAEGGAQEDVVEIYPDLGESLRGVIPFTFIGATNNDATIDDAPLLPLAELNIGHYRNSADNEESSFVVGQPTLFIYPGENLTPQAFKEANPNGIKFGSRRGHNLGYGGSAQLIQAGENNLARQNMLDKEQQAIQIGAQLITPTQQITAQSARIQRGADTSVMATIARNVSQAYTDALRWVAVMLGKPEDTEVEFRLNMDFFLEPMTAQDRAAWMADINAGLLPATAYYAALRKAGVTDWTDADIKDAIEDAPLPLGAVTQVAGEIPQAAQQPE
ncbi:62 kDa structural protein [Salmonella phage vB_SenS-EnJE1]|uniref:62 kDa structural protein n=1 Tax=Salmonella phage vB_SenS-EnJE1 TaxID=2603848 RepID=A0A649V0T1_9CAUD|nr:62 kDa structural protein [Salmonella phage vB_SenS-EnJE1]QGJ84411.1 62 kDa structural protein [Salmonella phage vB_SenS-EnJE1]